VKITKNTTLYQRHDEDDGVDDDNGSVKIFSPAIFCDKRSDVAALWRDQESDWALEDVSVKTLLLSLSLSFARFIAMKL